MSEFTNASKEVMQALRRHVIINKQVPCEVFRMIFFLLFGLPDPVPPRLLAVPLTLNVFYVNITVCRAVGYVMLIPML